MGGAVAENRCLTRQRVSAMASKVAVFIAGASLVGCGAVADITTSGDDAVLDGSSTEPLASETVTEASGGYSGEGTDAVPVETGVFVADPWPTVVTGALLTDEQYSISMKGEPSVTEDQNEFHPILDTIYQWRDGEEQMTLIVSDRTEHVDGGDAPDMQKAIAEFVLLDLMLDIGATERTSEPITYVPGGMETKLAGHEIGFDSSAGAGVIRSILKEQVGYSMVSISQAPEDTARFFHSLSIAPYELVDLEAEAAAASETLALTGRAEPFTDGPYGEREMLAASGGPDYIASPPEGAVEPGTHPELDPIFVACRDGDGVACDELYWAGFEADDALVYERFADTCGGRTVTESCTTLLGGNPSGEDPIIYSQDSDFRARNGVFRLELVPPPTMAAPGTKPHLDQLWLRCGVESDAEACRDLGLEALDFDGDIYGAFAATCGGRMRTVASAGCVNLMNTELVPAEGSPPPGLESGLDELWQRCSGGDRGSCTTLWLEAGSSDALTEEQKDSYKRFGRTCGGIVDRPMTDCNDFANWPVNG